MKLNCPHCSRTIPAENINIQTAIAKCGSCSAVFGFADKVPGTAPFGSSKRTVELPKGYSVDHDGTGLVITRRWWSWKYLALLGFCVFWNGFLVVWYFIAFTKGGPLIMKLFPLLHVAAGVALTYTGVAGLVNRTRITVNTAEVKVKHFPLPWLGNRLIPRQEIDQLFCEEKITSGKNRMHYSYNLSAVMRGGNRLKLVSGLDTPENALFLEQQIEGFLGITDRPVAGEMRPV
ncbi:MAG: hypothetical protein KKH28_00525 [Elusimicrobia bacterium]|nr:hypothetical protein [Elusimicrobiota bacterium]